MLNKLRKNINNFEIKFKFLFHILTDFYYVNEKTLNNIASFEDFFTFYVRNLGYHQKSKLKINSDNDLCFHKTSNNYKELNIKTK